MSGTLVVNDHDSVYVFPFIVPATPPTSLAPSRSRSATPPGHSSPASRGSPSGRSTRSPSLYTSGTGGGGGYTSGGGRGYTSGGGSSRPSSSRPMSPAGFSDSDGTNRSPQRWEASHWRVTAECWCLWRRKFAVQHVRRRSSTLRWNVTHRWSCIAKAYSRCISDVLIELTRVFSWCSPSRPWGMAMQPQLRQEAGRRGTPNDVTSPISRITMGTIARQSGMTTIRCDLSASITLWLVLHGWPNEIWGVLVLHSKISLIIIFLI